MASKAREAFNANATDVSRLLEIHGTLGGKGPGRRVQLEVLNKSAIVLLTAIWEAYCEDLAAEALEHVINTANSPNQLPNEIKRIVAEELKSAKHELAIWQLASDGWRAVLKARLKQLQDQRNRKFSGPKAAGVDELFAKALGMSAISAAWSWQGMSSANAKTKLDGYVELRGQIAHRAKASCYKWQVIDYFGHVKQLVDLTGQSVRIRAHETTGRWMP